ncbi:MAG: hypothetical protein K2X32_09430, partial [Phycisphaerales bacterium]|nr:hypothetical protein [Phycisphaerales bacterium]
RATIAKRPGLAILRSDLDEMLVNEAVSLGVRFEPRTSAAIVEDGDGCGDRGGAEADARGARDGDRLPRSLRLRTMAGDRVIDADVIICADGLGGASCGADPAFAERVDADGRFGVGCVIDAAAFEPGRMPSAGEIAMYVAPHAYVGLVRFRDGRVNLAAAVDVAWARDLGGPAAAVAETLRIAGGPVISPEALQLRGTSRLTRSRTRVASRGVLLLGDSAGYVEPFTGEGMAWALAGAMQLAELVGSAVGASERGTSWRDELGLAWQNWHQSHIRSRQRSCAMIKPLLRSPLVTRAGVWSLAHVPLVTSIASRVARHLERPYFEANGTIAHHAGARPPDNSRSNDDARLVTPATRVTT